MKANLFASAALVGMAALLPQLAEAQTASKGAPAAPGAEQVEEVVVTAQKRAQSINTVGMSINAVTSQQLQARGVTDTESLVRVVPGLTFQPSTQATPVYTLRGVGFFESSLASSPAVSVYVDEVPLPFPIMTAAAGLDAERVEVLKGPQGTLFGENSTGGAINYVAAKPTTTFAAGANVAATNFGQIDTSGYVSGPLRDTLTARLALRAVSGGAWQKSVTRPDDKLGDDNKQQARLLLDWRPTDRLKVAVNLNGYLDRSDTLAFQQYKATKNAPNVVSASTTSGSPRLADWSADWPMDANNWLTQGSVRADYKLNDTLTLTSITALTYQHVDLYLDADANALQGLDDRLSGFINAANQELRLSGDTDRAHWIVGGSYEHAHADDNESSALSQNNTLGVLGVSELTTRSVQSIETYAAFGNIDYKLTDALSVQGGIRYTKADRSAVSCAYDPSAGNGAGNLFTYLQTVYQALGLKATPVIPITAGQCVTLDAKTLSPVGPFHNGINQDNVSWRAGVTYKFDGGALVYATASRGYKAGTVSTIAASTTDQLAPVVQEKLNAYEAGFKTPLFDRRVHLNGSVFNYQYFNKQVRGITVDPLFGDVEKTVNVPHSRISGAEVEIEAHPLQGWALNVGATYLDTEIDRDFVTYSASEALTNFKGSPLPYTPKYQVVADTQYEWPFGDDLKGFVGAGATYHSVDNTTFHIASAPADDFRLKPYTLIDLRVGVAAADGSWRVTAFGQNITDTYYWTNVHQGSDTIYRTPGRPSVWGLRLSVQTR